MNSTDYSVLDETLEVMAPMGPDLNNGFSNHAPMAIEAMCAMGRGDAVMPWFEHYRRSLAPRRARVARLTNDNWRAALGDLRRTEDWFEFFRNELEEHPWQSVLDLWAARLAPGLMAAATHGVIRTGHATRALALEDTPARRRELADGLAYWAADYLPLPAERHTPARAKPSDAIARVPILPPETRHGNFGSFTDALAQLDSFPPFKATLDDVDPAGDPSAFLSDLTATFARVFLANAHDTYTTIAFVHAVTGPSALRPILPVPERYNHARRTRIRVAKRGCDVRDLRHARRPITTSMRSRSGITMILSIARSHAATSMRSSSPRFVYASMRSIRTRHCSRPPITRRKC